MTLMPIFEVHPLQDARWATFLDSHSKSSVFHTKPWIEALLQTYGYTPTVFTTNPPGEPLTNGILGCRVDSWLTGSRIVSLPFSDHCEPLLGRADDVQTRLTGIV